VVPDFDPTLLLWLNPSARSFSATAGGWRPSAQTWTFRRSVPPPWWFWRATIPATCLSERRRRRFKLALSGGRWGGRTAELLCRGAETAAGAGPWVFDPMRLAVFCVTGASQTRGLRAGPAQAVILRAITERDRRELSGAIHRSSTRWSVHDSTATHRVAE
jgi:hypothetical protein